MIYKKEVESRSGQTGLSMMEVTRRERSMDLVFTTGVITQSTEVSGWIIRSMESECIGGKIRESIRESGCKLTCMGMASIDGLMAGSIWDSSFKTRKKDLGYITGKTAECIVATG
jgi:hypothetical protein